MAFLNMKHRLSTCVASLAISLFAAAPLPAEAPPAAEKTELQKGMELAMKGDMDAAIASWTEWLKKNPKDASTYFNRGLARYRKGDLDAAIADYTSAIENNPKHPFAFSARGSAHYLSQKWDKAVADFDASSRMPRPDPNAMLMACALRMRQGGIEAGQKELRDALSARLDLDTGSWIWKLATFLLGKLDEKDLMAAAESKDEKKTREQQCEAWYFVAMRHLAAGRKEEAAAAFRKCVATDIKEDSQYLGAVAELKWLEEK